MKDARQGKKRSGVLLTILIVVCALIMAFALYKIISIQMNYKKAQNEYSALREYTEPAGNETAQAGLAESTSAEEAEEPEEQDDLDEVMKNVSKPDKKTAKAPITVDHASLAKMNPDYTAWLYIEALEISYPVMQGEDDEYYLHRTFNRDYLFAGSLFIHAESSRDFNDPHTIIYGHNMKDESMFGDLRLLYDNALYKESPYFWVLTPENNYRYRIFSMYECMGDSDTYVLFTGPGTVVEDYITEMKARSYVDLGEMEYDGDSKLVTLSTCVYAEGSERFVVQGILDQP